MSLNYVNIITDNVLRDITKPWDWNKPKYYGSQKSHRGEIYTQYFYSLYLIEVSLVLCCVWNLLYNP